MRKTAIHPGRAAFVALALLTLLGAPLWADPPAGYYDTVDTTNSTTLRNTVHDVIKDHVRYPYTDTTTDTWDIINLADEDPDNSSNIIDLYKNASYTKIPGGVGAYNREHSWPKSYGFPNDGPDNYPYTDCHHLFAADASYNTARSNKPFRLCNGSCTEYPTDVNNGRGGGSGTYPGNSNWSSGSFTQGTWETWDERKGDVARALFYMDVRYEGGVHGVTGSPEPDLRLTDDENLIDQSNTGANEAIGYMGFLSVLLQWHQQDPPDAHEMYRNDTVYSFQGNRNPFVDHPEWVACVFENNCAFDTVPPAAPQSLIATALNGGADLSWVANGEGDLAGYNVYRSTSSGGPYAKVNSGLVSTNAFTDTGLLNGTTYYYVVTAVDTSSNESPISNEASVVPDGGLPDTTPPAAPTGLGASGGDTQVSLSWNANGEADLDGYNVYRSTSTGGPYSLLNGTLLTSPAYTDTGLLNGTTYYYVVTAVDTSANESAASSEASATPAAPGGAGDVILSEVFYDANSTDDGWEWIELYNRGTGAVDLSGYSLGNGGTDYTYSTIQLSGTIQPGATFVVGGPNSDASNGSPAYDLVMNPNPDFQNSGTTGDGVALFDVPASQIAGAVPVDAVVYGPNNNNGLIDESGFANAPEVGDAPAGSSIERIDQAGNWVIQSSPTPNSTSLTPPSNTAPSVTITAPADGASFEEGTLVTFMGSASDAEEGDLTSGLAWVSDLDGPIGSGGAFTTALSVGTHTVTASVTDGGGLEGSDSITVTINAVGPSAGDLVLSEVLYDVASTDDGLEWVEIYNRGTTAVDLSGWSLGNGGLDYTTSLVQLSGTIQPGAVFVVGGPTSNATNYNPSFDLAVDFNPDFQNSGTAGDGVALFNVPASQVTASTVPIDAVVYGPNNDNGLIDETGFANPPEVGDAGAGASIERLDEAGNWAIQASPTPNSTPLNAPSNTAPSVTISAPGDGSTWNDGELITFVGTATDAEDGDLTTNLSWTSSLDGPIGSGGSFSTALSVGTHTITASVTDSGSLTGQDQITVTVQPLAGGTMHVASIVLSTFAKNRRGRAVVTIVDDQGSPVSGVTVDGSFSGDFNESGSSATNGSGEATFQTSGRVSNPSFTFCVDNVSGGSLTYDPASNVETCDTF